MWDRDTDTVYVTKSYRVCEATAVIHAAALSFGARTFPGLGRAMGAETLEGPASRGRSIPGPRARHARRARQFDDGSVTVEAGLADMLIGMESGGFKVFKHLTDWFDEYRL